MLLAGSTRVGLVWGLDWGFVKREVTVKVQ